MSRVLDIIENPSPAADPLGLARLPLDDLGMAERLRIRSGDRIAKTPDAGWLAFSDRQGFWQRGAKGEAQARRYAHMAQRALWDEYHAAKAAFDAWEKAGKPEDRKPKMWEGQPGAILDAIPSIGNAGVTAAILKQVESYVEAELRDFDPDPNLICCVNGTLQPTFIGEPCFVAFDADGVAAGWLKAETVHDAQPRSETAVASPWWPLAGWRVRMMPAEGNGQAVYEIIAPGDDEADAERLPASELKGGVKRKGLRLALALYHLDLMLLPHQPGHRITRQTSVAWDPKAKCPKWLKHIETVLPLKEDRDFFQRSIGNALLGSNEAQCFLFIQGKGADGKSTTMKAIARVLGTYFRSADPRTFLEVKNRSAADASPDIADLAGDTRGVYCEEPPKGARLNEAFLKQITGGLELRARQLHRDLFDFEPRMLLIMAFNDLPRVSGGDDGLWRRVRIVLFPHQFTLEEQLSAGNMVEKLVAEAPGIFNWALEGLAKYHKFGLQPHDRMKARIEEWRAATDPFGEWLRARVEFETGAKELTSDLYADYKEYLEREGIDGREVLGSRAFQNRLQSQQIETLKGDRGERFRRGVKLRLTPDDWLTPGGKVKRTRGGDDDIGGLDER